MRRPSNVAVASRTYRAACPNCGAPVEFRSAASAFAVCAYCQSTVVRKGDALERIGRMAELFDDFSPLQLGTSGQLPADIAASWHTGRAFMVVGRLQYRYGEGVWNEWFVSLDDASGAFNSDVTTDARMPDRGPFGLVGCARCGGEFAARHSIAHVEVVEVKHDTFKKCDFRCF